ncbi:MAG: S-adenosylmethionine decarboxylase [Cyanobacteria bacterium HKST-UBA06]|nr:S-adenosylmethionine decarboxylase [Cyanobacteria bacterium HKST-UBA04]MCA9808259.1 S-adenosylmethionine decarboxylase [Cyanobacteria bacterium HKST-UBA06]MCA9841413.1 S-adenosylmethionine decarboxylase [Cyanobacteria bacterium HKST-UBA03]
MMDCRGVDLAKCSDVGYIWQFLHDLPVEIGMTKITQPYVFPYCGLVPEDQGVTGSVIIAESHLTFHSFTQKDYFFFDLFSCKPFDVEYVMERVIRAFGVTHPEVHCVERGREFPRTEADPTRSFTDPTTDFNTPISVPPVTAAAAGVLVH